MTETARTQDFSTAARGARMGLACLDGFMVSLVFGWHLLIEGSKRLKGSE
jgi:hypothetical protein